MKSFIAMLLWIIGWTLVCLTASGCGSVSALVTRASHFTLTSLHTNSVSVSYTIPW